MYKEISISNSSLFWYQFWIWYLLEKKKKWDTTPAFQAMVVVKNPSANARDIRDAGLIPESGRSPGGGHGREWSSILARETKGQRSLVGYSPWGCKESGTSDLSCTQDITHRSAWVSTFLLWITRWVSKWGEKTPEYDGTYLAGSKMKCGKNWGYQIKYHSKPIIRSK